VRELHKLFRALDIDTRIFPQDSQNHAIHLGLLRSLNVVAHDFQFMVGVTEITGSGANHCVDGKTNVLADTLH